MRAQAGGERLIDAEQALGHEFPEACASYCERDVALYALGVGAGAEPSDLRFVYEGHHSFGPLPTFAVVPVLNAMIAQEREGRRAPGLRFGLDRVLHTEQLTEIAKPWPPRARLRHRLKVKAIYDRVKHAVVVTEGRTLDEAGDELARNEFVFTVRGAGGWGGSSGPSSDLDSLPTRPPDKILEQAIRVDQALIYRLCGDANPLHADPDFAQSVGLPKPILHGLCTFGFAARHVLSTFAGNEPGACRSVGARFSAPAYPGETLVTEMWREAESRVVFRCKVKERDKVVVSSAAMALRPGR